MDMLTNFAVGTFLIGVVVGMNLIVLLTIAIKMITFGKDEENNRGC